MSETHQPPVDKQRTATLIVLAVTNLILLTQIVAAHRQAWRVLALCGTMLDMNRQQNGLLEKDVKTITAMNTALHEQNEWIETNIKNLSDINHEMVQKANEVGFASALYGYASAQNGVDPIKFVSETRSMFTKTNFPQVEIYQGTNLVHL